MLDNYMLNLPKTNFPMKASLQKKELNFYEENILIYKKLIKQNKNNELFILHDGPPYANGDLHMGHALNKILKDFIIRYKNMSGYKAQLIPGWDTHGLPIEINVIKKFGTKCQTETLSFRKKCEDFAMQNVENQMTQFKKLNILADWDQSYLTCNPNFEAQQIKLFYHMLDEGYIYKGLKPVYWCTKDKTALAEAEIEYLDKPCKSIYVKFKLINSNNKLNEHDNKIYFIIWTTTPWTLLANVAIAINEDIFYCLIKNKINNELYIVAEDLLEKFIKIQNIEYELIQNKIHGYDLEYMISENPINNKESLVIKSSHVNLNSGTGIVHIAPGHGMDDYIACQKYKLPIIVCINEFGKIIPSELNLQYINMKYTEANEKIIEDLNKKNMIISYEYINHSYPHCWRCKTSVVFRATKQWFCSVNKLKKLAIDMCDNIKWIPHWGKDRMIKMLDERNDWCISRQRLWGVPIPILYCKKCNKIIMNKNINSNIIQLFNKYGSNCWYDKKFLNMLTDVKCSCGASKENIIQEYDIMDVWFDSGTSHFLLSENKNLKWPADIYLEGNDQYRGWFQSSLLTSIAFYKKAPYKQIITHGWIVDNEGNKMSKSLGNGINPLKIIEKFGTDILRLCICSMDFRTDIILSDKLLQQISQSYTKIRNTARFILSNINDVINTKIIVLNNTLIDKFILFKLNNLIKKIINYYENYEFHMVFQAVYKFCTVDLSNFYFDIIKDILYCNAKNDVRRLNIQTILYNILLNLIKILAPILPYTTQEIWNEINYITKSPYVMLSKFPVYNSKYELTDLEMKQMNLILKIKEKVNKALEISRQNKNIGKSLEANLTLKMNSKNFDLIKKINLNEIFIISYSNIIINNEYNDTKIDVIIEKNNFEKCIRCWIHTNNITNQLCPRCYKVIYNDNRQQK